MAIYKGSIKLDSNGLKTSSVPVGTIVQYDGDTVPEGYEEVTSSNLSLLSVSSSQQNFSVSQSGSANSVKIVATSTALSYGSGFSLNNGNIKIDDEPKLIQFFVEVNPYSIGIDQTKSMSIALRRNRGGTVTNVGGGEQSRYGNVMKWSFTAIDEAQVGDEYWCAVVNGASGTTLSCTIGATAKFFTVKKLADIES